MWKRWFPKLRKACEATESATIIFKKQQWRHHDVGNGTAASTGAVTYVFKGQDYGGNDAGHKNYNSQDAEKTLALGEVHLWRERTCFNMPEGANAQQPLWTAAHLRLEAEDCDADADDRCDGHSDKHRLCIVETENK